MRRGHAIIEEQCVAFCAFCYCVQARLTREPVMQWRRVLLQALTHPLAANKEMCVVNSQGPPPSSQAEWDQVFVGLESRERQMGQLLR